MRCEQKASAGPRANGFESERSGGGGPGGNPFT